jgi:uncharacterized membrane protein
MAGIGWRLERMLERDTLGGSLGAVLTGVAVTSGPWLLTTSLLVLMRASAMASGVTEVTEAERVITVIYAVIIVTSAPIDIVLTRYSADCVYEERRERIGGPLCRVLAAGIAAFTLIGGTAMWICQVPLSLAVPGTVLAAVVGAQWLLLSAAGGLSSPGIILRAFGLGAPASVLGWLVFAGPLELGPSGYLYGFGAGQVVTLSLLLWGTLSALPARVDDDARVAPAFRNYWMLAAAAFAFNAGLWVDKLAVLLMSGEELASQYAALAAVAWLSVIPACAYLFVTVETAFHRRFEGFYSALDEGASLVQLELLSQQLQLQVKRTLRGTASVQLGVTLLCLMAAPSLVGWLGLTGAPAHTISWLFIGAGLQVVAVCAVLLLYYFDFRREALLAAITQLVTNTLFTVNIGAPAAELGIGYALACGVTTVVSIGLLASRMPGLIPRTFQSQPDLSEA